MAEPPAASSNGPATEVGSGIVAPGGVWSFGGHTPELFDKHVRQSIPGYRACHELILDLAEQLCPADGVCYDLGCSTGTLSWSLAGGLGPRGVRVIGVDRDSDMVEQADRGAGGPPAPQFIASAIEDMEFERADLVVCFYTLQFVPVRHRAALLGRLRRALEPEGTLILFEKTLASSGVEQEIAEGAYLEFKRRNGFSTTEIVEKRRSLRGILAPLPASRNEALLRGAGFSPILHVFRWLMFDGVIAFPSTAE